MGFKVASLQVIAHPILGTNTFEFTDKDDEPTAIYNSILIGPNGTGKSEILSLLITLFKNLTAKVMSVREVDMGFLFLLTYHKQGEKFLYTNAESLDYRQSLEGQTKGKRHLGSVYSESSGSEISIQQISSSLPQSIIANSIMLTDKFFVPRNIEDQNDYPIYKYLGVRNRPQQASTRSYVRKTVEFIVGQRDSSVFRDGLAKITQFLNLEKSLHVLFYTIHTTKFFTGNISKWDLDDYFNEIEINYQKNKKTPPFKLGNYKALSKDSEFIKRLCEFINTLVSNQFLESIPRSSTKVIKYDIVNQESHSKLREDYECLEAMRRIGLLHAPEVSLKNDKEIDLQNSSSGEFHFFSTMVGLMATITENGLVLIDEPEISLHPNWQMKYLSFLRQLFSDKKYHSSQIIIATHSHFLISDLKGESASILTLKKDKGVLIPEQLSLNTYGWSAEEVLYKVFDVRTTRNYYVEMDLRKLLEMIATKSKDTNSLMIILNRLKEVKLSENDPLNLVITQAEKYITND